jgi:hypothetical protein
MSTVSCTFCGWLLLMPLAGTTMVSATAQVEMDRILVRVNGRVITQSDVRQARTLALVDDVGSDAAAERGLEDRYLILGEMSRAAAIAPPSDADVAAHRAEWAARLGGADVASLLARGGMSEADLQAWLRDDLRIRAYFKRQFGMLAEGDRARATGDWLGRLRQRADLR